ncbi:MAG TPA: PEPxxWA-CTERM sorting domain-containing protein [Phenylobacterium sp.]|nr:PEPxxWA-CTERM sorting domain-containing protein [Phenylobacterium sp.]
MTIRFSLGRVATTAVAACMLAGAVSSSAQAAIITGNWQSGGGGSFAYAQGSSGWLDPGDYLIRWSSVDPITGGEINLDEELRQHAETYDGVVLFDSNIIHDAGLYLLPAGARGFLAPYSVPEDINIFAQNYFYTERVRGYVSFLMNAGPEAIGQPYSFSVTGVPEPATWATMILGFGLAGVALRRRRARLAA